MSHAQQDPAAATAPFDSRADGVAVRPLAQGQPTAILAHGSSARTLAQGQPSAILAHGSSARTLAQGQPSAILAHGSSARTLAQGEPREITVVATKFAFEPSRIEVTEGERVRLVVTSADIPHGIAIKKFRVDKTIPRGGKAVSIEFTAVAAGEYPILCSEYCGQGHDEMKGSLVVIAKEQ